MIMRPERTGQLDTGKRSAAGIRETRYNGYGETREEVNALGQTTVVERDAMGRRLRVTSADEETTFAWDKAAHGVGQLASAVSPDGTMVSYAYDNRRAR